ncbi:DNA topoisomerase 2 [Leucoagaricus sp. SymC.cos]|nr:DNA topoisomerase 2 [Leucoagaricus sp. SymC.cos]
MSSSESENFDFDISESEFEEDYAPAKKKLAEKSKAAPKTAAKPKGTASKATTKPKPTKKVLVDRDDNAEHEVVDNFSDDDDVPALAKKTQTGPAKKKTASETYTKLSQLEHILKRPDSYIGSIETITQLMWTYDANTKRMVQRDVKYVPGFLKIVDEILVNAADNKINDPSMDTIKVSINVEENTISVYNSGRGIPIEIHSQEKIYIPELIFGHLLSSSNYDDDEKKLTGGRNGYGAKLANIYSHEFTIETADKNTEQKYKQTWTNNMGNCGKAKITKNSKGEEWTRITFKPDLKRFGMNGIDEDTAGLLRKRVYDMAGTVKDVKVYLNDERLKIKNFKQYVDMYVESVQAEAAENSGGAAQPKTQVIYERLSDRWEIAFAVSDGTFQQVSFANSISTIKGGTHVLYVADQLSKHIMTAVSKKNKGAPVKPAQIRNHLWLFVNALIENPTFDSQTKETLTLPSSKFGSKPVVKEDFIKKVLKTAVIDNILHWAKTKADQQIKRTDGTKRNRLIGMAKLSDANNAGTRLAKDCTLILTEGDSAKALAVAGLGVVGRDYFGVFPLRGKLLNVREARHDQIMKNEEIQNIKKILGLQHNKDYLDVSSLRYGRLMIMADQDHDGSHIKGLLINFFDHFYPSLLKLQEFLVEFVTPIVRITKGKQRRDFFTLPEYEKWLSETPDAHKWDSKYYKGLGTSDDADARDYFSHMAKHMIPFAPTQQGDRELIELAFSKKKADDRKEWLRQFKPGTYLDHNLEEIPYSEFINKELICFSMADNIRSIPSVADGLKPGQRKVIWSCFKRKLKKEIKVAQLVGYISEHAAYHHGEASLASTIVNLAQDFVGSNNVNLLSPNGQYGTRDQGGKDHASPRYIFTEPKRMARVMYNPADDPLLNPQKEDNQWIEPEFYVPVIPIVLCNGAEGIGTGWSTNVPCYNPVDIVTNIRRLMKGEEQVPVLPWWRGFKGEIIATAKHKYDVHGVIRKLDDTTVEITELPIHKWTQNYKAELEAMIAGGENKEGVIKDYKEHHDNANVHFVINMAAKDMQKAEEQGLLEFFKLTSKLTTSNMICFDFDGKIKKYDSPEEIIEEFYPVRLAYYQKRKDYLASELQNALDKLNNQARFVKMIVDKRLIVSGRRKADIVADLRKHEFKPFPKAAKTKSAEQEENPDDADQEEEAGADSDFDYLLGMAIWSLTKEKIDKLLQQAGDKEAELLALLEKTPIDLWNKDLDDFLVEWEDDCRDWESKKYANGGKGKKKKQAKLKTRKSIGGGGGDDSDDDFKPVKAAAARKKAEPKKVKDGNDEVKKPPVRKTIAAAKKLFEDGDDDDKDNVRMSGIDDGLNYADFGVDGNSKTKANGKAKEKMSGKGKEKAIEIDDNESEEEVIKPSKSKSRAKAVAVASMSKSESDVEMESLKEKVKVARKAKETIDIVSDDDDDFIASKPVADDKPKSKAKRKSPEVDGDDNSPPRKKKAVITNWLTKKTDEPVAKKPAASVQPRKVSKSMKPASPKAREKKAAAIKKRIVESDGEGDGDSDFDDLPKPPPRKAAPARAAASKSKYVEVSSDEDGGDDSMFVDDD